MLAYGRRYVKYRVFYAINIACAIFLTYLAGSLLWNTITNL
jgi:hypothetical protein